MPNVSISDSTETKYLLSLSLTSWNYAVYGTLTQTQCRIQASKCQMGPAMMAMSASCAVIPSVCFTCTIAQRVQGHEEHRPGWDTRIDEVKSFNVMHSYAGESMNDICFQEACGDIGEGRSWTLSLCSMSTILLKLE